MAKLLKTCPDCGSTMVLETGTIADPKPPVLTGYPLRGAIAETAYIERPARFYACTGCERCEEVTR